MIKLFTAFFLLIGSSAVLAQKLTSDELHQLTIVGGKTAAETAVNIGKRFIGRPYVPHTLDAAPTETLVVNVRAFDCTTYLETVLALALAHHQSQNNANGIPLEASFRNYLTQFRYRAGRIDGYASRLHYFSDWLRDNEQKRLLMDITGELPGSITVAKPVSYMTTALYKYPRLSDPTTLKQMLLAEAALNQQSFLFIPKKNIRLAESHLREGDIVMLTAARPGLDMKHVGLAVRQPNGRIHLMHASSDQGKVVITRYPLSNYLLYHKHLSGVRVARLRGNGVLTAAVMKQ